MHPEENGVFFIENEYIPNENSGILQGASFLQGSGNTAKVIKEAKVLEDSDELVVDVQPVARLDPGYPQPVVSLYINKEAKYGMAIYEDGILEVFEYDDAKLDWRKTIGPADPGVPDNMLYARSRKFPASDHDLISYHLDHTDDTLTATFIVAPDELIQLTVGMDYTLLGKLDRFNFAWNDDTESVLAALQVPDGLSPV